MGRSFIRVDGFVEPLNFTTSTWRKLSFIFLLTKYCKIRDMIPVEEELLRVIGMPREADQDQRRIFATIFNRMLRQLQSEFLMCFEKERFRYPARNGFTSSAVVRIVSYGYLHQPSLNRLFEEHTPEFEEHVIKEFIPTPRNFSH